MKVLVTGGAGFIGSHIVDACIHRGDHVIVVDNLSTGNRENIHEQASFYQLDIQESQLEDVFEKERPDVVIHQAAQIQVDKSVRDPLFDASTNVLGTIHLLECCIKYDVKKVVYASTAAVYGDPSYVPIDEKHPIQPLSGYGCSKYSAEKYVEMYSQLYGLKYTILRYANVYGERQDPRGEGGVISVFVDKTLQKEPLTVFGDGEQTRDYIFVDDIAKANIEAMIGSDGEILNIGTGVSTSLNDVVQMFQAISGQQNNVRYGPERVGDIKHSYFDVMKAHTGLPWESKVTLMDGLERTYAYYLQKYRRLDRD